VTAVVKVLDSFTSTFEFKGLTFDVGLRTFLESFKLPGEAQKIDRIINCFGRAYYRWAGWQADKRCGMVQVLQYIRTELVCSVDFWVVDFWVVDKYLDEQLLMVQQC